MLKIFLGNLGGAFGTVAAVVIAAWILGTSPETAAHMIGGALLAVAARTGFDMAGKQDEDN